MKNNTSNPLKILLIFTEVFLLLVGTTLKLFHIATALGNIFLWFSIGLGLSLFVSAIPNVLLRLKVLSGLSALCVLIGFTIRAFFTTYEAFGNFLIIIALAFVGTFAVNKFFPPKTRQ